MAIFNSYVKLPEGNLNISEPIQAQKKALQKLLRNGQVPKKLSIKIAEEIKC
jgi:hypothetical protein